MAQPLGDPQNRELDAEITEIDVADDVEQFLEDWGVTGGTRKRKGRVRGGSDNAAHPGFVDAGKARFQHVSNLVAMMRHLASIRDDASLAQVLSTLLQSENPANMKMVWQFRHKPAHARMAETLLTGYHLLRRNPSAASFDTLKRYLRRAQHYQLTTAGKDAVALLLARLMLEHGQAADAYDLLTSMPERSDGGTADYERCALLGSIRYRQWAEAMQGAVAGVASSQNASHSQRESRGEGKSAGAAGGMWGGFSRSVWASAGRARELCRDVELHLRRALQLRPEATMAAVTLVQTLCAQGRRADALRVAREQCQRAPCDVDAHATSLLLLLSDGGVNAAAAAEAAQRACGVLQCDPSCASAAQVLVELGTQYPGLPATSLVEGLCRYLDTTPPTLAPPPSDLAVWEMVSSTLRALAGSVVSLHSTLREVTAELRRVQHAPGAPRALEVAASSMQLAHAELEAALSHWRAASLTLQQREWWEECHLRLPTSQVQAEQLLQQGKAGAEALAALGAVHAAQRAALERHRVASLRLGRAAAAVAPPAAAPAISAALRRQRAPSLADHLDSFVAAIQAAHTSEFELRQGQAHAASSLAAAAAAAATFAVEVGEAWRPPLSWQPIPIGSSHPQLGPIAALQPSWWRAFPQVRRRQALQRQQRQQQQRERQLAEELLCCQPTGPAVEQPPPPAEVQILGHGGTARGGPREVVGSQPTQPSQRPVRFHLPGDM